MQRRRPRARVDRGPRPRPARPTVVGSRQILRLSALRALFLPRPQKRPPRRHYEPLGRQVGFACIKGFPEGPGPPYKARPGRPGAAPAASARSRVHARPIAGNKEAPEGRAKSSLARIKLARARRACPHAATLLARWRMGHPRQEHRFALSFRDDRPELLCPIPRFVPQKGAPKGGPKLGPGLGPELLCQLIVL
jgi:hypothetical protein